MVLTTLSQLSEASKYFQTVFSNPVREKKLRSGQDRTDKDYRREDKWLDEVITDVYGPVVYMLNVKGTYEKGRMR